MAKLNSVVRPLLTLRMLLMIDSFDDSGGIKKWNNTNKMFNNHCVCFIKVVVAAVDRLQPFEL